MELNGLRKSYGDKALVCPNCNHALDVEKLIEEMENNPEKIVLTPRKIDDLCFTWCTNCESLELHELKDKDKIKDAKIQGYTHISSKPEQTTENEVDTSKPFSVGT